MPRHSCGRSSCGPAPFSKMHIVASTVTALVTFIGIVVATNEYPTIGQSLMSSYCDSQPYNMQETYPNLLRAATLVLSLQADG